MDGDDPKGSLIALIVEVVSQRGPSDRLVSVLTAGGDAAAETISAVLDHALDVLEQLSVSSPRKSRKSVLELMEEVEEVLEAVDGAWCDGVSRCGSDHLQELVACLLATQTLGLGAESVDAVSGLLDSLRECGSVAVQCESVLRAESDGSARIRALECVRALSSTHQQTASALEASLLGALKDHLCSSTGALDCEESLSCWLALAVLGYRCGESARPASFFLGVW